MGGEWVNERRILPHCDLKENKSNSWCYGTGLMGRVENPFSPSGGGGKG